MQEYDSIKLIFEVTDNHVDGGESRTRLEKDTAIVANFETHLEVIIDSFVSFMEDYGFQKSTVLNGLQEHIDYENGNN